MKIKYKKKEIFSKTNQSLIYDYISIKFKPKGTKKTNKTKLQMDSSSAFSSATFVS